MDRGRAGGFITDNNFVGVQFNKKKRNDHLHRLEKIMDRTPGSSHTLDNNPPVIIKAALTNPRKMAVKDYFYFVTERENKSLLKRIGSILTAPPTITEKDYLEMKSRCVSSGRGLKAQYEQKIVEKKNRDFFEHLKTVKPYYKAKVWEDDYKKQRFNQQFMRQVKYNRPVGFVDKFHQPQKSASESKNHKDAKYVSSDKKFSSSHVDRIRAHKVHQSGSKSRLAKSGSAVIGSSNFTKGSRVGTAESNSYDEDFDNSDGDEEYNTEGENWNTSSPVYAEIDNRQNANETKVSLAMVERSIKVLRSNTTELSSGNSGFMNEGYMDDVDFIDGTVECYLINREILVVKAVGIDRGEKLEVEAEINLNSLSSLGDFTYNPQSLNLTMLNDIAQEMVENVEIKVDNNSDIQLVLNLFSENSEVDMMNNSKDQEFAAYSLQATNGSVMHEEQLSEMLLPDAHQKILSCGVKIPVSFIVSTGVQAINNIMLLIDYAKLAQKIEHVFALLTISSTVDDQLLVTAYFVSSTQYTYKRGNKIKPAVSVGMQLNLICPLPSIVQVDPDMILSFAENLSTNLKIEHDCKTGENNFIMT